MRPTNAHCGAAACTFPAIKKSDWVNASARRFSQEMEIGEVEELLQRRGILKDPVLADKAAAMQKEREAKEAEMRAAREKSDKAEL